MCISTSRSSTKTLSAPIPDPSILSNQLVKEVAGAGAGKNHRHHLIVKHNYHDHANDSPLQYAQNYPVRGGVTTPFPLKLHEMLEATEEEGMSDIVSWQPHGRCFVVHKPKEFIKLLPRFFKLSKLPSFQRQLNLYGFQRITKGDDKGAYYHELFLRNRVFMAHSIQRSKVKGTGVRARSNPAEEPNFYKMPFINKTTQSPTTVAHSVPSWQPVEFPELPSLEVQEEQQQHAQEHPDDDLVYSFGNRTFHAIDVSPCLLPPPENVFSDPTMDVDTFFDDFAFPEDVLESNNLEDDNVFGNLLEQIIA